MMGTALADAEPPLGADPTVSIGSPREAFTVAEAIMQMSTVGLGSGGGHVSDGGLWEALAAGPLAAALYAASPNGNRLGMQWVVEAVDEFDSQQFNAPNWARAAALFRHCPVVALGIIRMLDMNARQRDSVAMTLRAAISPWRRTSPQFPPTSIDNPTERNES